MKQSLIVLTRWPNESRIKWQLVQSLVNPLNGEETFSLNEALIEDEIDKETSAMSVCVNYLY